MKISLKFKRLFFLCLFPSALFSADRGIVIPCNDNYLPYAIGQLHVLRSKFLCELPIEIWYAGDELSLASQKKLSRFGPISFRDIVKRHRKHPQEFYQGWQIKGFALAYSQFDEVMMIDADVCFFQDPLRLFDHEGYKQTGAFLFRDQGWSYQGGKVEGNCKRKFSNPYYFTRKEFIRKAVESPSSFLPVDWRHYWNDAAGPSRKNRIPVDHGESGVVLIDKKRHRAGVSKILELNGNYEEVYQVFFGDKETYWFAFEIEKEPYFINPELPKTYLPTEFNTSERVDIIQFLDGKPFYFQKKLLKPQEKPQFLDTNFLTHPTEVSNFTGHVRHLTQEEIDLFNETYFLSNMDR